MQIVLFKIITRLKKKKSILFYEILNELLYLEKKSSRVNSFKLLHLIMLKFIITQESIDKVRKISEIS